MITFFFRRWVANHVMGWLHEHARAAFEEGVVFFKGSSVFFNALMVAEFLNGARNMCCLG